MQTFYGVQATVDPPGGSRIGLIRRPLTKVGRYARTGHDHARKQVQAQADFFRKHLDGFVV